MEIAGIDHLEFYVGDAVQSAFYHCAALGFSITGRGGPDTGLAGQRSVLVEQGSIRLLLTTGLTDDHPATRYVRTHGDGVAVLAMNTPDARGAYHEALSLGATPLGPPREFRSGDALVVTAEVAGIGDLAYRFVQRTAETDRADASPAPAGVAEFLPGTLPRVNETEHIDDRLTLVDHLAICLAPGSLADTVARHQHVLGFRKIFAERIEIGAQAMDSAVVQSVSGNVTLTLLEPDRTLEPGQIDRFLDAHHGPGVQHVAYLTDDIITTVDTLSERGVRFLTTAGAYYDALQERLGTSDVAIDELRRTNVLVDRDHWGEVFQIFTHPEHVRGTYFTEIIDRHGARTFGSGNIRALYEAVRAQEHEPAATVASPKNGAS